MVQVDWCLRFNNVVLLENWDLILNNKSNSKTVWYPDQINHYTNEKKIQRFTIHQPFPFGEFKSLTISLQTSGESAASMLNPCFLKVFMSWTWP